MSPTTGPEPSEQGYGKDVGAHGENPQSTETAVAELKAAHQEQDASISATENPKVRFSTELSPSAQRVLMHANLKEGSAKPQSLATFRSAHDIANIPTGLDTPENSSGSSTNRSRNRGYSLRRSLFAQNIGKDVVAPPVVIELSDKGNASGAIQARSIEDKGDKRRTTITISEQVNDEVDLPSRRIRLFDPSHDIPFYQQWIAKQKARITLPPLPRRVTKTYEKLYDKITGVTHIPPSVDGRHLRVNTLPSINPIDERTHKAYIKNSIRSCRYTPLNFVPRQLYAQFGKLANFYFLCVSTLQMVPDFSTTGTYTTIIPLLVFVAISMLKEGYDDIRRNRLDKEENERSTSILESLHTGLQTPDPKRRASDSSLDTRCSQWRTDKWINVRVGDVVLLEGDYAIPADVVLLHSDRPDGYAYVETKSLDGETNLKSKRPLKEISDCCKTLDAIAQLDAEFVVEDPNLDLYKFEGRVTIDGKTIPLTNNEVIYRGSVLRNTTKAYGLVIYSGEECKIRMNANKHPRVKAPTLQFSVNKVVVIVSLTVVFIAIVMTIGYRLWQKSTENHAWYLYFAEVPFGHIIVSFIIMFNTMLPLSLYVSMEMIKLGQMFLMNDVDMYDPDSDTPMEPHTSTINEELGQVNYIFSDKTGTLTNNSMRFRKLSVAGVAWLHDPDIQEEAQKDAGHEKLRHKKRGDKGKSVAPKSRLSTQASVIRKSTGSDLHSIDTTRRSMANSDWQPSTHQAPSSHIGRTEEMIDYIMRKPNTVFARKAKFFLLGLAVCHTCGLEEDDEGTISFEATSPDELALVTAAQDMKYIMAERDSKHITIRTFPNGEHGEPLEETFEILDVIEFSSTRKRMSIIVRMPDNRICLLSKGADTTLRKLLRNADVAANASAVVEQRASHRKSLEANEAIRRRNSQAQPRPSLGRSSLGNAVSSAIPSRNNSVTLSRMHNTRDSIDTWLKEREHDIEIQNSTPTIFNEAWASAPFGSSRLSGLSNHRISHGRIDPRHPMTRSDDIDELIDENVVLDDQAVFSRCFQHIDDFAGEGLRTLLYGYRYISQEDYASWRTAYADATTSISDRQDKVEKAGALIEQQLELLGATAIEDKLQKGVPDAIDRLRRAGIKLWMLTGDKRETAINIGHSCRLIKDYSTVIILDHEQGDLPARLAQAVTDMSGKNIAHSVLVIDGQTLTTIDIDPPTKALFTDLAITADAVICCRASPSQKAALVRTIRTKVKGSVTLAIGDGANDIAMIQEAHLGIGIAGKEGLQAARVSDYSIAQFRFLLKLILVHGRWNYVRTCKYVLGTFWKEMVFYIVQAMYQRWNGYTGTSLYEPWSMSMFNTLFTSLPVIFMGVFEKDLSAATLLAVPELYSFGRLNQGFNLRIYAQWATLASVEAVFIYLMATQIYGMSLFARDMQLYGMGSLAFTACVIIISIKLQLIELHNKSIAAAIAIFLSIGGWWLWNLLLSLIYPRTTIYNVNHGLLSSFGRNPVWWCALLVIVVGLCVIEFGLKSIQVAIWPSDVDTFQEYERDLEVRKRFEESAADLLQQGWERGKKKSSLQLAREEADQAEREAHVEQLLERHRTREQDQNTVRRRHSGPTEDGEVAVKLGQADGHEAPRKSLDIGELFSKGFGAVRKGPDLR